VTIEIPILRQLQRIIDASPTGDLTFLVGLRHCSAHGLRKAGATTAFGWATLNEAERYTKVACDTHRRSFAYG
jgi:hypothetical protein